MKKFFTIFLPFFLMISFSIFSIYWFTIAYTFNKKVQEMKDNMYFVPLNPEEATLNDWTYLKSEEWINLNAIDISNFYFVYSTMKVDGQSPNLYFYTDKTTSDLENGIYKDELKESILELSIFFTSLKYLTYTEEFADLIINDNDSLILGSSGEHYYFSPYALYNQDNVQYNEAPSGEQSKLNPLELLLEYRNINYNLTIGYKLPEWIFYDYKYYADSFYYEIEDFSSLDPFYKNVEGIGSAPSDSPMITIPWDASTFENPESLKNSNTYTGYLTQKRDFFGYGIPIDSNGVKHTPKYLNNSEIVMHEIGHNLGYKHTEENRYKDSIYWAGETYQKIYDETFSSKKYNEELTVSDWFSNEISFDSKENWEQYNLYSSLWNYSLDQLGDITLLNHYSQLSSESNQNTTLDLSI